MEEIQLALFRIGEDEYVVNIMRIKEVIKYQKITHVPKSPPFIEGVINLRGIVVPIVDMRKRFDIPSPSINPKVRIIIMQVEDRILGILVDEVSDVIKLPASSIMPPPKIIKGIEAEFLEGVCEVKERVLLLLNIDKILTVAEKVRWNHE
ncbi:MAG: chemotaxis protein CheW [Thermodesulfobacteriota bacterium]